MKTWIAALAMLAAAAAGASAQTTPRGEIGRKAGGEVGRRVAEVVQPGSRQPSSVMLGEDQLVVLIIGLDGQQQRGASIIAGKRARRGSMKVVNHGVSTTLEDSDGSASVRYFMDVEQDGLAHLRSSPPRSAAVIVNAFMDFWINAPRTLCPGKNIEPCFPLNLPL